VREERIEPQKVEPQISQIGADLREEEKEVYHEGTKGAKTRGEKEEEVLDRIDRIHRMQKGGGSCCGATSAEAQGKRGRRVLRQD